MANIKYYPEDELVQKVQSGEYGWLDYINHHSPEWQEEYTEFCNERNLVVNEESAEDFIEWKGELVETGEYQHLKSITICQSDQMHYPRTS